MSEDLKTFLEKNPSDPEILKAVDVGLTARCARHLEIADSWDVVLCLDCLDRILERARTELFRRDSC